MLTGNGFIRHILNPININLGNASQPLSIQGETYDNDEYALAEE